MPSLLMWSSLSESAAQAWVHLGPCPRPGMNAPCPTESAVQLVSRQRYIALLLLRFKMLLMTAAGGTTEARSMQDLRPSRSASNDIGKIEIGTASDMTLEQSAGSMIGGCRVENSEVGARWYFTICCLLQLED